MWWWVDLLAVHKRVATVEFVIAVLSIIMARNTLDFYQAPSNSKRQTQLILPENQAKSHRSFKRIFQAG